MTDGDSTSVFRRLTDRWPQLKLTQRASPPGKIGTAGTCPPLVPNLSIIGVNKMGITQVAKTFLNEFEPLL